VYRPSVVLLRFGGRKGRINGRKRKERRLGSVSARSRRKKRGKKSIREEKLSLRLKATLGSLPIAD